MPLIRAGVGLSTAADTIAAAAEASRRAMSGLGASRADWCVAFTTADHGTRLDPLVTGISIECGTPYVVGCSGWGVVAEGREIDFRIRCTESAITVALEGDELLRAPIDTSPLGAWGLGAQSGSTGVWKRIEVGAEK